ncbi:MAG: hypothetical protein JW786_08275 [Desulfobacterales bacterium]|nr:hypothetical protein [Desulfobacterales bacterium]
MKECKTEIREIKDLQSYLKDLYGNVNSNREWDYLYGYLSRTAGIVSKQITNAPRYRTLSEIDKTQFVLAISWLFSLSNYFEIDVADSYLKKYPGICPYCMVSPCVCYKTKKMPGINIPIYKIEEEKQWKYNDIKNQGALINSKWVISNTRAIYPANDTLWHHAGPWYHFTKLSEELAELHEAISKNQVGKKGEDAVSQEIADVFTWFISIWSSVFHDITLEDSMIDHYYNGCPECKQKPCTCPDRNSRPTDHINLDALNEINNRLHDLGSLKVIDEGIINDLQRAVEAAIDTQSEPRMVQASTHTYDKLKRIDSSLDKIDEAGKKASSIITTILTLIEKSSRIFGYWT